MVSPVIEIHCSYSIYFTYAHTFVTRIKCIGAVAQFIHQDKCANQYLLLQERYIQGMLCVSFTLKSLEIQNCFLLVSHCAFSLAPKSHPHVA
ncbi:hypothetical protein FKM82_026985 [Ascaphus truei]